MWSHLEIRQKFLDFFVARGHYKLPSASLIPEYDPTLLLTNSGMAPLKPYFLGLKMPPSQRLTNIQKCLRTGDIESVGDISHSTFFEMMGNWSIGLPDESNFQLSGQGPYFKRQACELALGLLRQFKIDEKRLYFGVFGGDSSLPNVNPDEETRNAWSSLGVAREKIISLGAKDAFWVSGPTGPCGPNTDVIYDLGKGYGCGLDGCSPTHDCGRFLEIWNAGVFMMYNRQNDGTLEELPIKSVDAGAGLERFALVLQSVKSMYETDLFKPLVEEISSLVKIRNKEVNEKFLRIVADHIRAAVFLIGDGLQPSNTEAGYVLRRLIRRAVAFGHLLSIEGYFLSGLSEAVVATFQETYPNLSQAHSVIHQVLEDEEKKFGGVLKKGMGRLEKYFQKSEARVVTGDFAFKLFDSLGFPVDLTRELSRVRGFEVDLKSFEKNLESQKERSRQSRPKESYAPEKIKTAHTAAHLLNAVLKKTLGDSVHQMGQKIGQKSFRHDFNFGRKLKEEEINQIEFLVNEVISQNLSVSKETTTFERARAEGAEALFEDKYRRVDRVTLYKIGPIKSSGEYFSKELCGGPHADFTGELKKFKIVKEEAVAAGVRRIEAQVEG